MLRGIWSFDKVHLVWGMPRKNVHRYRRRRFGFGQVHLALVGFLVLGGLMAADEVRKASEIKGITGPVRGVRDGDTILVKGVPIRLNVRRLRLATRLRALLIPVQVVPPNSFVLAIFASSWLSTGMA